MAYTPNDFPAEVSPAALVSTGHPSARWVAFGLFPTACGRLLSAGLYLSVRVALLYLRGAPLGETLHKNYQAICDTFLYCVL